VISLVYDADTVPVHVEEKDRHIEHQCPPKTSQAKKKYYYQMNAIFRED
jgi:hypothetical protein